MSDAYGTIIFGKTNETVCDFDGLVETLNKYEWNWSEVKWVKYGSGSDTSLRLECNGYDQVMYPTVSPNYIKSVVVEIEGKEERVFNPTMEEIENSIDQENDTCSLEKLSAEISRHIKQGQITICAISNDKLWCAVMEKLTIRSDGSGSRKISQVGVDFDEETVEYYQPIH